MALPKAGVELVAEGLNEFIAGLDKATAALNKFGEQGSSGGKQFDSGFSEVVIGGLRKIGELGVEALLKAGQVVGGFVKDSIGLAGDFQAGMLEFQAVAGKDVDTKGLEKFHDLFLQLGKDLPVSTSDVEKAAIEMVKGGIDPATVAAGGLRQNIQFAAAAMGGDLVAAANVSAKILGGWSDVNATAEQKAAFLTHATDQLTKAANASSVDVHELSLGIFNAQGIAKTAGVSFDDLTTTLAALSPRFASSSEAGNSLKNVIARLQPTTKSATAAMEGLGLIAADGSNKFYDAQGSFIGFEQASQLLQDSLRGLTDEQKQSVLQTIFGNDAMNAASGLAELGAAGYQKMADALSTANGVAENAALKQQGYNTALENAKGSVEALQITVGEKLLPVLTDLLNNVVAPAINTVTDFATAMFETNDPVDLLVSTLNDFSPLLADIVIIIGTLVVDIQDIIGAFDDAGASSSDFASAIGYLADDLGLPGDLIADIVFGLQDLVNWFGQASDEGDSLGGVVEDLSGIWQKMIGIVEDVASAYQAIARSVLPIVTRFVEEHGDEISSFFKSAYDQIISIINLALDLYDAIVPKVLGEVADFISEHATGIQSVMSGVWDAISGIISAALTLIEGTLKVALDVIHGDWEKAWTDLQAMSVSFVESLGQVIKGFLEIIAGFFNTSLDNIVQTWQDNWDMMIDIAMTVADRMVDVGRDIVDGILSGLRANWDRILGWVSDKAKSIAQAALDAIGAGSPAKLFMPVGEFGVMGIIEGFESAWPRLTSLVTKLGDDLVSQVKDLADQLQGTIADSFGATASIDRQLAKNLDALQNVLPAYQSFAQGALEAAKNQALMFADPTEGAKFFKMRSDQILEYEKLRKKLAETESSVDRERIRQQMELINSAQIAELKQFDANQAASGGGYGDFIDKLQSILGTKGMPGVLESGVVSQLYQLISQLQNPPNPWANPPASAAQIYGQSAMQTSYSYNRTLNMPIYTNQSPSVMQDSAAIAWASMP